MLSIFDIQDILAVHTFRKLDVQDIVFIEYAPLETAWVSICGICTVFG